MAREDLPVYLVQDKNNVMHGYWRRDVLRCDLAMNKDAPPQAIYKLGRERIVVRYKRLISRV